MIFLDFFLMSNDSTLPLTLSFKTTTRLSNLNIRPKMISKIIQNLDQNKVHGQDDMCGLSIINHFSCYLIIV